VFGLPRREDESGSGVEDRLKSIQEVTGDTNQNCAAVIDFADKVGMHQGSALSPLLFVIVMKPYVENLELPYLGSCCVLMIWL